MQCGYRRGQCIRIRRVLDGAECEEGAMYGTDIEGIRLRTRRFADGCDELARIVLGGAELLALQPLEGGRHVVERRG